MLRMAPLSTIPTSLDKPLAPCLSIWFTLRAVAWSTQSLHQGSNLYLPQSLPDLKIILYSEITGDRGRLRELAISRPEASFECFSTQTKSYR